jgi:ABC-type transport system involved in multi-copper enzyme maturation permease subunit
MFNLSLVRLSVRQLVGRHRWFTLFFLVVLAALPALIAGLILGFAPLLEEGSFGESARTTMSRTLFENLMLTWIVPTLVLLGGANVLREEMQNQTIAYLYLKPISRLGLVLSKFTGALVPPLGLTVMGIAFSTAVLGDGRVGAFLATGVVATLAYSALFFALSLFLNRTVIWAFGYLLIWEGFLFGISRPASYLSIKRYTLSLQEAMLGGFSEPSREVDLAVLFVFVVLCVALSVWRVCTMEFPGSTE